MNHPRWSFILPLLLTGLLAAPAPAETPAIPESDITALQQRLADVDESASSARRRLSLKRVIRRAERTLEQNTDAPNRFEVLDVLFRTRQQLVQIDDSPENRQALIATARRLADAPDRYALLRLDADLLINQIQTARADDDSQSRADALIPLVDRYRHTEAEFKAIKIALIMALEFGDSRVISHLRETIARRFPGNQELIHFLRDNLPGQIFGAPFIARLEQVDGPPMCFPMDGIGMISIIHFWSAQGEGRKDIEALARAWKNPDIKNPDQEVLGRVQIISVNVDDLPDGGKSVLDQLGVDWPVLKLPGGRDHPVYQTYAGGDPSIRQISATGYCVIPRVGPRRASSYRRNLHRFFVRPWTEPRYLTHLRSISSGEFLVIPAGEPFDSAAPPELLAHQPDADPLAPSANDVPAATLEKIQACFIRPPGRYQLSPDQQLANYQEADRLCREAIAAHSDAPNLWLVRNRHIAALLNLWKLTVRVEPFKAAVEQARAVVDSDPPAGTDILARFCLARDALRQPEADRDAIIEAFVNANGPDAAATLAAAALLAIDAGRRPLYTRYRRRFLDQHADHPTLWTPTAFFLNRHRGYWMFRPPFTAGWTFGRRWRHHVEKGEPNDAERTFDITLKTRDGETIDFPEAADGKWIIIGFVPTAADDEHMWRYTQFVKDRAFDDIHRVLA
ncbi:MAG: hypothetical protein R3336_07760, partial [Phycisphaeraceae bacterium]|nr:hypothetical protein [Phycisphaeraceae bacterium]